jgi:TolB-like protein/DNA-binding SARP family transcriptional activator
LLGFLALSGKPVTRTRLCSLLWDVPNDPRGELRWCLSKLRALLDDPEHPRVVTSDDQVSLALDDDQVDARQLAACQDFAQPPARLAALAALVRGPLLAGAELESNAEFTGWLSAERQRLRGRHAAVLEALATRAESPDERLRWLQAWLLEAPFDARPHQLMLQALVEGGRPRDADDHLAATIRAFEQEQVDWAPLREALRAARAAAPARTAVAAPVIAAPTGAPLVTGAPAARGRAPGGRAAVAIMPFADLVSGGSATPGRGSLGDGLAEDIIMQLAKLRGLFVIGRGTVFSLGERGFAALEAGRTLNVDYVASGSVRRSGQRGISVVVELIAADDGRIVWTDALEGAADDPFAVLDDIGARIVAAIAEEIELAESQRALLKPPNSLDAWEAYHRGLWHMYKFTGPDNHAAGGLFEAALARDPSFARAHAGLSFTHFQNAFLGLTSDRDKQITLAYDAAAHSLGADEQDPTAHWAMGRALWLGGALDDALDELRRSTELSPNFALGHYTLGFVQSQSGDPHAAISATNHSRLLSPFDPLQFGMLASRALAHVRLDEYDEAAQWALKATSRPNAHAHILAIAAQCLELAKRRDEARAFVARIRARRPDNTLEDFMRAFRFAPDLARLFRANARRIGLSE